MEKDMPDFINLTPHDIVLFGYDEGEKIPPTGVVARVFTKYLSYETIGGILISNQVASDIRNLPEPKENTFYIVSSRVAQTVGKARQDVLAPDVQGAIRDSSGKIQKVRQLVRYN